jgi:tetratricopeptide (TPR) repeat protein
MAAATTLTQGEIAQLMQTIEMFEVISQSQPHDCQSLEILKEAYTKLGQDQQAVGIAKRIAQAYVHLGQFSSAILEYETILQRYPEDAEVQAALRTIEAKAAGAPADDQLQPQPEAGAAAFAQSLGNASKWAKAAPVEDGREAMRKLLLDAKVVTPDDFDRWWETPDMSQPPNGVVEPFIQVLADQSILPVDQSLRLLANKTHLGYVPLERYDPDLDLTRDFPAETCRRWCVFPFDRMSKSVLVATANPFNQQAANELAAATHFRLLWYLAAPEELVKNLRKAFR